MLPLNRTMGPKQLVFEQIVCCSHAEFGKEYLLHSSHDIRLLISKVFLLVEQIRSTTTQVDDLRATVPIFLQPSAFVTVEGI